MALDSKINGNNLYTFFTDFDIVLKKRTNVQFIFHFVISM